MTPPWPLATLELRGSQPGPHLLLFGGVHGDEFEPMAAIRRIMASLDAADLRGRVTAVPVVNEPAFVRGDRAGEDGLDLARTFPGKADGTPTECIAAAAAGLIREADYFIDLHTGGTRLAVLPLAGYTLHPDPAVLETQRRTARAFNLPIVWGTDPNLDGRSLSVARDARVPAIYAEYMGRGVCDPAGVEAYVDGCLNVMAMLEMIDRPQPASRFEHCVEDPRPGAGHLQVANPSPITGFFEPAIQLGDHVTAGQILGTVCDGLGQSRHTMTAAHDGMVIVLHTCPRVLEGVSVAVVLEVSP